MISPSGHIGGWKTAARLGSGRDGARQIAAQVGRHGFGVSSATASASEAGTCAWLPSRRIETVRSSASRLPTTSITGTLASECSRTL